MARQDVLPKLRISEMMAYRIPWFTIHPGHSQADLAYVFSILTHTVRPQKDMRRGHYVGR